MENNKKGYWLKGIFTAIIVAAFCFVLSLCITTKDSKVEAEASDFSANFNLNETLTK